MSIYSAGFMNESERFSNKIILLLQLGVLMKLQDLNASFIMAPSSISYVQVSLKVIIIMESWQQTGTWRKL